MRTLLRFALWCLLLGSLCFIFATEAAAESAGEPRPNKERAQVHFERGIEEFRAERYKAAIDAFLLANDLYPSSAISFNIARAYESLGDASGALRFYRDYLRRTSAAPDAAQIAKRIEAFEDRLRQLGLQQVTILSTPLGATLLLDGRAVGITPWTGDLIPGSHSVKLLQRGYAEELAQFELSSHRSAELTFPLDPLPSAIEPATHGEVTPAAASSLPPAPPVAPQPIEPPPARSGMSFLPWVSLGAGALALAGAGYFELSSANAEKRARRAPTQAEAFTHIDDMHRDQLAARISLGVGIGLAATGGLLLLWDVGGAEEERQLALGCAGHLCSMRGSF
jgi:tetratricopeptide (TPR) repeat protein